MAAAGLAVYLVVPFGGTSNQEKISIGQGFVRNAIREDLRATFGSDEETRVEPLADNKFLIAGWVDVISEAGETDRQDFSCVIFKSGDDNWVGERVAVISQHF